MSNRLCVLIALPRPIVTLMASKDGEIVPAPRWEKAHGAMAVPPLRETPKLDAVYGALRGRPIRLTLLRHAAVESLQDALRDRPHVFVLDTHGDEEGTLLLEGPCGETNPLSAAELGRMLARRGVRLAVLSACHSAAAADALRAAGVPIVVGMTESIYEDAAAVYLAAFLGALASGDPPREAHGEGLALLRTRFGRREGEAGLPRLFRKDYAAARPLVADLAGHFEDATPRLPAPQPERPVARLFGRQLDQVLAQQLLLQGDGRLATLTGMGGIGKTALARAVARWAWQRNLFPGGVYFASLENLAAGETAAARLAAKLDLIPGQGQTPEDALAAALGRPLPALLAADNCETAAGAGLEVLTALRRRCPRLRILATGRRPLSLEGESLYRLPPLALNDAVAMFQHRAGRPEKASERPTVEAICRQLDRVPLHIELVASHRRTPAEILDGLDDAARAHHLTAADRPDLPARQRSQLLSFYYTWDRLRPAGQKTWAAFAAVFANGAGAEALQAVLGPAFDAGAGLEEVVDWHVLERWEADGRSRYGMLATTAEFGRARAAGPEADLALPALRRRHAEHYLAVARRFDETPMEKWWALEPDMDNVVAGFEKAIAEMETALGAPLKDLVVDWESLLERQKEEDQASLAGEYGLALKDYVFRRRPPQSERWLGAGLVAWTAAGHQRRVGLFCNELGLIHKARGDYAAALEWYQKSVALKEELGDKAGLAASFNNIGNVHNARGDYAAALEWYQKSVALEEELGNKAGLATSFNNIGGVYLAQDDLQGALEWAQKALDMKRELQAWADVALLCFNVGIVYYRLGNAEQATVYCHESAVLCHRLNLPGQVEQVLAFLRRTGLPLPSGL